MSEIKDVKWINLPSSTDQRGILTAVESDKDVPFEIKRIFYMHQITASRGGHAHLDTNQVLIGISGKFTLEISDGKTKQTHKINNPKKGIYIPKMIFINMFDFSKDAVCLVIADTHYDIKKNIKSWEEYLELINVVGI